MYVGTLRGKSECTRPASAAYVAPSPSACVVLLPIQGFQVLSLSGKLGPRSLSISARRWHADVWRVPCYDATTRLSRPVLACAGPLDPLLYVARSAPWPRPCPCRLQHRQFMAASLLRLLLHPSPSCFPLSQPIVAAVFQQTIIVNLHRTSLSAYILRSAVVCGRLHPLERSSLPLSWQLLFTNHH